MRYKPYLGKLFFAILIIICIIFIVPAVLMFIFGSIYAGWIMIAVIFPIVFILAISSAFGYVELKEEELFVRYGLFVRKSIPYSKIKGVTKKHAIYCNGLINMKTSLDHLEIQYNAYDYVSISLREADQFIVELEEKIKK